MKICALLSIVALTAYSTRPSQGKISVSVDEKYNTKIIVGGGRAQPDSSTIAQAYMNRASKREQWKPFNSVRLIFFRLEKSENDFAPWHSVKTDAPFHLYLSDSTINGRVRFATQNSPHAGFNAFFSLPQFIAIARSQKASLVCKQIKLTFSTELLSNLSKVADELENKSKP